MPLYSYYNVYISPKEGIAPPPLGMGLEAQRSYSRNGGEFLGIYTLPKRRAHSIIYIRKGHSVCHIEPFHLRLNFRDQSKCLVQTN